MADRVHIVRPPLGVVTRQAAETQAKVTGGAANLATQSAIQLEKNGEDSRFARAARWDKPRATELIAGLARIKDMRKEADKEAELARKDPWHRARKRRKQHGEGQHGEPDQNDAFEGPEDEELQALAGEKPSQPEEAQSAAPPPQVSASLEIADGHQEPTK